MYTFQTRVRYSEVDPQRRMELSSILNCFQDCSNFHSQDLGGGIDTLTARKRVWLLSAWQIEIVRPPRLFDHITVGTWPYAFKGLYGYRNFIIYNEERGHETAAYANSIWFLMDTETGLPARIAPEDSAAYLLEEAYPMDYAPRKIALPAVNLPDSVFSVQSFPEIRVTRMLLDTNNHVNNGQYVRLAEGVLPENFAVRGMRAEYRRAALLDDVIFPVLYAAPTEDTCYVSLNDAAGQPFAIVSFRGGHCPEAECAEYRGV